MLVGAAGLALLVLLPTLGYFWRDITTQRSSLSLGGVPEHWAHLAGEARRDPLAARTASAANSLAGGLPAAVPVSQPAAPVSQQPAFDESHQPSEIERSPFRYRFIEPDLARILDDAQRFLADPDRAEQYLITLRESVRSTPEREDPFGRLLVRLETDAAWARMVERSPRLRNSLQTLIHAESMFTAIRTDVNPGESPLTPRELVDGMSFDLEQALLSRELKQDVRYENLKGLYVAVILLDRREAIRAIELEIEAARKTGGKTLWR